MRKEELLNLLTKYGLDSKYQDPYIYENDGRLGLLISFSHVFYGFLSRVIYFDNLEQAEDFVYQYWWYKKYQSKFQVSIELDHYDNISPEFSFKINDKKVSKEQMMSLLIDPEELPKEEKKKKIYQRYLRTARILVKIVEEKIKVQNDTYHNVKELNIEYLKQENEFIQFYNRYQKDNKPLNVIEEKLEEDFDMKMEVQYLSGEIDKLSTMFDFEQLKVCIESLWQTLLAIECDNKHLQNKYLLFKLPIDLEDIRKKKSYMEFIFNKKKGIFSKRENVLEELQKIDDESENHKIININDYINNEVKRLEEKYSIITEMDYATLGDYLNEFDNLGIISPMDSQDKPKEKIFTREEIYDSYMKIYESLSLEDQHLLAIFNSFLKPICLEITKELLNGSTSIASMIKNKFSQEIYKALIILNDPENVFLRMQNMKLLSLVNENEFVKSLIEVCESIIKLQAFKVVGVSYVFGKSSNFNNLLIYQASLKNVGTPSQQEKANIHDIVTLNPGVSVVFFPKYFAVSDVDFQDNTLEVQTNREDILLILKNYKLISENSDIIRVSRYQFRHIEKFVTDISLSKMDSYRHVVVSK